jgi:hypothetical protein
MVQRCTDKNCWAYKYYGERGIKVYPRWLEFKNFLEDIGEIPKGLTLDRIDNNKGYYPNNWRFATRKQQNRNTRTNLMITFNNKTQCLKDWAKELDIKYTTLWNRIYKYNWSIEKSFTTLIKKYKRRKKYED